MTDEELIEELRSFASDLETDGDAHEAAIVRKAADRIKLLSEALVRIASDETVVYWIADFARATLDPANGEQNR